MIVYDAGALVAAERNERRMWLLHDAALRRGLSPLVPAGVLAQAWRGGPQAALSRLLRGCTVTPLDEDVAREAGVLCGFAGTSDVVDASVVDASVVAVAQHAGGSIVTSDGDDLRYLSDAAGWSISVQDL